MKKVYTNSSDVIHLFAERSQDEARCSNVFFHKNRIYSYGYHYLMGEFINDESIYINDSGYSVTTAKHVSELRYGTRQYKQFLKTECDIDLVSSSVKQNLEKLANARKPEIYINNILHLWEKLNEYLDYSKSKDVKKTDKYKDVKKAVNLINKDSVNFKEALLKQKKADDKKKKAAIKKLLVDKIDKFYSYEIDNFRTGDEDYVRISQDNKSIETSQRVSVGIDDAKILYKLISLGKDIKGYRIGSYTVISINGVLKIGCHNINIESMHLTGKKL
jgi:hypothetical protein